MVLGWEEGWLVGFEANGRKDRQGEKNPEAHSEQIHVSHPYSGLCNGKQRMNSPNEKEFILSDL